MSQRPTHLILGTTYVCWNPKLVRECVRAMPNYNDERFDLETGAGTSMRAAWSHLRLQPIDENLPHRGSPFESVSGHTNQMAHLPPIILCSIFWNFSMRKEHVIDWLNYAKWLTLGRFSRTGQTIKSSSKNFYQWKKHENLHSFSFAFIFWAPCFWKKQLDQVTFNRNHMVFVNIGAPKLGISSELLRFLACRDFFA